MTRRRIAIFLPSARGGGAERAMLTIAGAFAAMGNEVDVVFSSFEGPLTEIIPDGVQTVDLRAAGVLRSLPGLTGYLRRRRPDALFATMTHANIGALLATLTRGAKTPVIVREANVPLTDGKFKKSAAARVSRFLIRAFYPRAKGVIAVANDVAEELCTLAPALRSRIAVLPNPVVSPELFTRAAEPLSDPWFADDAPPVVLGAGRLGTQKDFPTLVRAFAAARRQRELRLVILGDGPDREQLQNLSRELGVESDVKLPGFVINPFPYMKRAGVFVLSSIYEGMPNVLLQALALGVRVVSTDCPGGSRDALMGGRYGRLVAAGDHRALSRAILETLESPPPQGAAQDIAARYSVEAAAKAYLEMLD